MNLLKPETTRFAGHEDGKLSLYREGQQTVDDVHCIMLFPFSAPEHFISIVGRAVKGEAGKEPEPVDPAGTGAGGEKRPENGAGTDEKKPDEDELGIIETLSAFPSDQQALLRKAIDNRYFMPRITEIQQIRSEHGLDEWKVNTDRGARTFYVTEVKDNLNIDLRGMILITDIEGCRYRIIAPESLPARSRTELAKVLL